MELSQSPQSRGHDPLTDGFRDKWTVTGQEDMPLRRYVEILDLLRKEGLNVNVESPEADFLITKASLMSFSFNTKYSKHVAKSVWSALSSRRGDRLAALVQAGVEQIVYHNGYDIADVVAVDGLSVVRVIAGGSLYSIYGFMTDKSESTEFLERYIAEKYYTPQYAEEL